MSRSWKVNSWTSKRKSKESPINSVGMDRAGHSKEPPRRNRERGPRKSRIELKQEQDRIGHLLKFFPTYWIGGTSMAGMVEALARNGEAIFHYSAEAGEPVRIALGKHTKTSRRTLICSSVVTVSSEPGIRRSAGEIIA